MSKFKDEDYCEDDYEEKEEKEEKYDNIDHIYIDSINIDNINKNNYNNKVWMLDLFNEFDMIINYYSQIDDRFKWIDINDILLSRYSYKAFNTVRITNDDHINEFINDFLNEINSIVHWMNRKKLQIFEEDKHIFDKLLSLNDKKIYSRIAYRFEKMYVC